MIAIVAGAADAHALAVARVLRAAGERTAIVDTSRQAREGALAHRIGRERRLTADDGEPVDLDAVDCVWYRRPRPVAPPDGLLDPRDRRFAAREWAEALDGLLLSLSARFVNPIGAQRAAVKPQQLEVACRAGLTVPDTLVTSDPRAARAFIATHDGAVVHKSLTPPPDQLLATRRVTAQDAAALDALPVAPTIFQREVRGEYDLRVTVAGDELLAARIGPARGDEVDARLDLSAPHEAYELPPHVARGLLATMSELGLEYGAVDMKIDGDGEHVFLEVNPQGQFLYIEILTGLPITDAVARLLAGTRVGRCRNGRSRGTVSVPAAADLSRPM